MAPLCRRSSGWIFLLFLPLCGCHFDFNELSSVHYGIEILGTPVLAGNEEGSSMMLTSIYGQPYQCWYPDQQAEVEREREEEKVAEELGISHLLKPMETSPCLVHTKDWWTYEFCYGKHIRQYHVENGKPSGEIMHLGFYESEVDWSSENEQVRKSRLNRYHSQQYVNGSVCDLTGTPRRAEVRFVCEEGAGDYVARIDETSTCVYILTVHTTKTCHHPYLKPVVMRKSLAITCNPLLSADEYAEYQAEMQAQKEKRESFVRQAHMNFDDPETIERSIEEQSKKWSEQKRQQQVEDSEDYDPDMEDDPDLQHDLGTDDTDPEDPDEGLKFESAQNPTTEVNEEVVVNELMEELQKLLVESLAKELQTHFDKVDLGELGDADPEDLNVESETIEGQTLRDTFNVKDQVVPSEDNVEPQEDTVEGTRVKMTRATPQTQDDDDDVAIETEGDDDDIIEEFDKGLSDIKRERRLKKIAKYKETLNSAMQAQFSTIVDEAREELGREGMEGEVNKPEAYRQLANTLSKLLNRLERTEQDIQKIEDKIASKRKQAEQLKQEAAKLDEDETTEEEEDESSSQDTDPDIPKQSTARKDLRDNRVKVRITRLKQAPDGSTDSLSSASGGKLHIPDEQREQLENSVQQELQKAGLDAKGNKVEVRIITAGYYNSDDDTLHILSEEDSTAFNKMIVTILGGSAAEEKETERQKQMQQNYEFNWKKDKKPKLTIPPP